MNTVALRMVLAAGAAATPPQRVKTAPREP